MAEAIKRSDPSGWIARQQIGAGTATHLPVRCDMVALTFNSTANGSLIQWQNPENVAVLATVIIHTTVAGTGTAGVDIGVGTVNGSSDNLLDAARVDTLDFVRAGSADLGTNGRQWRRMSAKGGTADYITGKANDIDATAGANAYITYIPVS